MPLAQLFRIILWQPLFNLLILFYLYLPGHDFGMAIIFLTVLIRLILWPLQEKVTKSQIVLQKIQPKIKELQEKYKDDREKLGKEFLKLYRSQKVNPFSGFLILLIQLPILFALYRVFGKGLNKENFVYLYNFVPKPEMIDPTFFGLIDLNQPNTILAILLGLLQFIQIKTATFRSEKKKKNFSGKFQTQMSYVMSVFIVLIFLRLPSALALYLLVSIIFAIIQQKIVKRRIKDYEEREN
jgi:YidC/Oxa1 family membrane protein insertase